MTPPTQVHLPRSHATQRKHVIHVSTPLAPPTPPTLEQIARHFSNSKYMYPDSKCFFLNTWFFIRFLLSHRHFLLFLIWITFFTIRFTFTLAWCINYFDSFILVVILKTFEFMLSVLIGAHIPPDESSKVS